MAEITCKEEARPRRLDLREREKGSKQGKRKKEKARIN
jgi:hypothetical protein